MLNSRFRSGEICSMPRRKQSNKRNRVKGSGRRRATGSHRLPSDAIKATAELFREHRGNLTKAAEAAGLSRKCLQERVQNYPELQQALEEAREMTGDLVEAGLIDNAIDNGNVAAQIFYLKTQRRWRETDPEDGAKEIVVRVEYSDEFYQKGNR